ncbi:MBL fold metallo-hydrolase [Serpentinicella alkaliphila]|uniref:Competence protein ComEC n=1 Tax=Serpentinicella alkaliphila TaxID=1734049 RepID=A0A4R2U6B4_9FIRM|nr:MBL fold metallo-hydrolase [Serpentinicella alkaliphila]QUH26450.1 MBL fold metallo-hydrolase [Serpentinicella alkaliphila]TCQ03273.1 competence protein ComEC [Serpentinicella alkaliphila]
MNNMFLFFFLLSFTGLLIGLIRPTLVIKWGNKRNRKQVIKTYLIASMAFLVLFSITLEPVYNSNEILLGAKESNDKEISTEANEKLDTGFVKEDLIVVNENDELKETKLKKELNTTENLVIHFIDVGQGDATFIQTPGGKAILIDAGERHMGSKVVSYIKSLDIDTIDLLIGTHPHADHIGGLEEVINNFNIGIVSMPKVTHTSKGFEDLLLAIQNKNISIKTARAGVTFDIDSMVELLLVAPNSAQYSILNDYSAVLKITYGNSSFLITGDAEINSEMEMIKQKHDLNVDVLRTGHHGSGTSSTSQFLNATSPKYAIVSVGKGNRYNHPSRDVINRLINNGIEIFRTDEFGTIVFSTDGQTYDVNIKKPYQTLPPKDIPTDQPTKLSNINKDNIEKAEVENTSSPNNASNGKININTASLKELQQIIHIGPERAEELISKRPFSSLDGLTSINGIGAGRLKDIKNEGKAYVQ